jgi:hypothetical protein
MRSSSEPSGMGTAVCCTIAPLHPGATGGEDHDEHQASGRPRPIRTAHPQGAALTDATSTRAFFGSSCGRCTEARMGARIS